MRKTLARIIVFGLFLLPLNVVAQLTVIIDQLPEYTPQEDSIYLVGSFNNWKPNDQNFRFHKLSDGSWQYSFLTPMPDFEFKITRGSWVKVEGGHVSEPIGNHSYTYTGKQKDTLRISVEAWEDLKEEIPYRDTLPIKIISLPENTPIDAALYVVGSFNGWSPGDPDFRMERDSNGYFRTTIPIRTNITEFKISRGNWNTVESRENGLSRPNRLFNYTEDSKEELLQIEIANWEDLAGNRINWYAMVMLLAALQGLLLVIAINSFKERHRRTNRILSLLIIVLSATFLARIGAFDRDIFQQYPKIILLPDLIYFAYGPLFWLYLRSLTPITPYRWRWFWHFLPLALVVLIYLPQIFKTNFDFITQVVNLQLRPVFISIAAIGLLFNSFYWLRSRRFLQQLNTDYAADGLPILSFFAHRILSPHLVLVTLAKYLPRRSCRTLAGIQLDSYYRQDDRCHLACTGYRCLYHGLLRYAATTNFPECSTQFHHAIYTVSAAHFLKCADQGCSCDSFGDSNVFSLDGTTRRIPLIGEAYGGASALPQSWT